MEGHPRDFVSKIFFSKMTYIGVKTPEKSKKALPTHGKNLRPLYAIFFMALYTYVVVLMIR